MKLHLGSSYDDLAGRYRDFPVVMNLEGVDHVYSPRTYAATLFSLPQSSGTAILSTPYHGYWKNLALAASGTMDAHFTALCDSGHLKSLSIKTLGALLNESMFVNVRFKRVRRIPILAKSMIAIAKKP